METAESANTATNDTLEILTALLDRAQQHAMNVAAEHFSDLPVKVIDWKVSHRAQRQAGVTKYNPATEAITIVLTWTAYEHHGWEQFSATVRHELIHAWQYYEFGEADHQATFIRWTDDLDTSKHCERFTAPKWWLICDDCDGRSAWCQRSKTACNPEQYCCSEYGGSLRVEVGLILLKPSPIMTVFIS